MKVADKWLTWLERKIFCEVTEVTLTHFQTKTAPVC